MGGILSFDLVPFVQGHLSLLFHVSRTPYLLEDSDILRRAVIRYRHFLVLRAFGFAERTPLDVEWIWHVHRLHPMEYARDCERAFGKIVPSLFKKVKKDSDNEFLILHIDRNSYDITSPLTPDLQRLISDFHPSVDLVAAVLRQKNFIEQSKIFYGCNESVLRILQKDYLKFIQLHKEYEKPFILVPTLGIDLIWHTHMRFPEVYEQDTEKFLGYVLNHNDDTGKKWKERYGRDYYKSVNTINEIIWSAPYLNGNLYLGAWSWTKQEGIANGGFVKTLKTNTQNTTTLSGYSCGSSCGAPGRHRPVKNTNDNNNNINEGKIKNEKKKRVRFLGSIGLEIKEN